MPKTSEGDEDKSPSQLKEGEPIARLVDRETVSTPVQKCPFGPVEMGPT